ncbi:MAG: hypothetical protein ACYS8I_05110 [Planctomycetota bacterium]
MMQKRRAFTLIGVGGGGGYDGRYVAIPQAEIARRRLVVNYSSGADCFENLGQFDFPKGRKELVQPQPAFYGLPDTGGGFLVSKC